MLDITEFFGDTTGGVRTYLLEKAKYVQRDPALRQVLVVPGARDEILEAGGVRCYRLHGPSHPDPEALPLHAGHPLHRRGSSRTSGPT